MIHDQASSLRKLNAQKQQAPSFAFIGEKGAGTTTVVTELAVALACSGQEVLLVDCRAGQKAARRLGVPLTATLDGQALNDCPTLSDIVARSRYGVTLVNLYGTPPQRAWYAMQSWQNLATEFSHLEGSAKAILIEAPSPAFDPMPASIADNLILILGPESSSLTMAYATIKRLSGQHRRLCFNILVNRVDELHDAQALFTRLSLVAGEFLTVSLRWLGFIPEDRAIIRSRALHRPSVNLFPHGESSMAFIQLARMLPQWHTHEKEQINRGFINKLMAASRDWAQNEGMS